MNVTRNVINDLLPAYLFGEVSTDTRALVEEFLEQDPEFARSVVQCKKEDLAKIEMLKGADMRLSPDHEMQTFARTKAMLERRSWLLALALVFTLFPFSFIFKDGHLTWMMIRDVPQMALMSLAVSVGFWIARFVTDRQLRTTGL